MAALGAWAPASPGAGREGSPAPVLPSDPRVWIGTPQSWAGLRGRVVLLDVWTFG
jgi:hypothetical protein